MEFGKIQCSTGHSELKHSQINSLKGDSKYTMEACQKIQNLLISSLNREISSRRKDVLKEIGNAGKADVIFGTWQSGG